MWKQKGGQERRCRHSRKEEGSGKRERAVHRTQAFSAFLGIERKNLASGRGTKAMMDDIRERPKQGKCREQKKRHWPESGQSNEEGEMV